MVVGLLVTREHYLRLLLAAVHAHASDHVSVWLPTRRQGSEWQLTTSAEVAFIIFTRVDWSVMNYAVNSSDGLLFSKVWVIFNKLSIIRTCLSRLNFVRNIKLFMSLIVLSILREGLSLRIPATWPTVANIWAFVLTPLTLLFGILVGHFVDSFLNFLIDAQRRGTTLFSVIRLLQ